MQHYTYAHIRNDTGKIFYIGKGSSGRHEVAQNRNQYWHNIVNKHGFKSEILAYWNSVEEAFDHEKLLISCFKDMGYKLANLTEGGEGSVGYKLTPEQNRKMRIALTGRKLPEEVKRKISIGGKGRVVSEETKSKMSAWQKGVAKTEEMKKGFKKIKSTNRSGFHNVYWEKRVNKWTVLITINGKQKCMGRFVDLELADLVAQEAREKYY